MGSTFAGSVFGHPVLHYAKLLQYFKHFFLKMGSTFAGSVFGHPVVRKDVSAKYVYVVDKH